jgi:hypothetical protein
MGMAVQADARPDTATLRVQVLLAARGGCRAELADRLDAEAREAAVRLGSPARVVALVEIDDDPFPQANPLCRPYDAVLEIEAPAGAGAHALLGAVDGIGHRMDELVHADLSGALVGAPQFIIPCDVTPIRYLYLMRRKARTTREQYVDYYFHNHSRFGFLTPGIAGYTQFHVDPDASARAAARLGFGVCAVDSVSELHLHSLQEFFEGIGDGRLGAEAAADEERFVDRANSVSFCTTTRTVASGGS